MIQSDAEKIVASYDPELIRRISRFARPYLGMLVAALVALILATVGDVLVPVIIQRTVDRYLIARYVIAAPEVASTLGDESSIVAVNGTTYLRSDVLSALSRAERVALRDDNRLGSDEFIVAPRAPSEPLPDSLAPTAVAARDDRWIVLPAASVEALPFEERLALQAGRLEGLYRNATLFAATLVAVLIASFAQVYLTAATGQAVMRDLRLNVYRHITRQSLGYLGAQSVGRMVTRVTNDVETINELFTSVLAQLLKNVSLMVAVVVTMFMINSRLATIVVATMVPAVLLTEIFRRWARTAYRRARAAVSRVNGYLAEYVAGMTIVQLFVQERRSRGEFSERNEELKRASLGEMYVFATFRPIIDFLSAVSTATVVYVGARLLEVEIVSLGTLVAFTNLIRRFYMPVMSLSEQFTLLQSAMAGGERVFDLLDTRNEIPDTGTHTIERVRGAVTFEEVTFAYNVEEPVLQGVSFDVAPGSLVAIVGTTGSGKTTIINLLSRLWDVTGGSIRLDGVDVRHLPLNELRGAVLQIQQDVHVFSDTIRANIALGLDVSDADIWRAAEAVQIADLIRGMPEGLDSRLQERGANLSAGQRQLLSFARVLVHNPPVLVLDEATSSIDSDTERRLQAAVETVTGGRTSVVIAHRLSTIQHADEILVLHQGRIIERGTHRSLLAAGGRYARLHELQYRDTRDS